MLINSPNISGSLKVTGNAVITGSLTVLGGINATIEGTAATASYVQYTSVANKPTLVSGSSQISFTGITSKPTLVSGSGQISFTGITNKPTLVSGSSQVSFTGITNKPTLVSGSSQISYSGIFGKPSGIVSSSVQVRGYNLFATTGSNQFNGSQAITGSLTVTGQVVAQTLNVQQVTSSIVFSSGSNIFGNSLSNTQQFTGSVSVTGSLAVNGTSAVTGTGTTNFLPKFTGTSTIGNSSLNDDGTSVAVGITLTSNVGNLQVGGTANTSLFSQQGTDTVRMGVRASGRTGISIDSSNATFTNRMWYLDNVGANGSLTIGRSGLDVLTFSNAGNLGLGVTPSAWVDYKVLQFGGGSISSYTDNLFIEVNQNAFWNGSSYVYVNNGFASRYQQNVGRHEWYTAPTGTATNAISFTQAMTLGTNSGLSIGTTSAAPSQGLLVQGNVGIGVSPDVRLDVLGTSDTSDVVRIRKSSTGSIRGALGTQSGVGYLDLYNDSSALNIRLLADGSSYFNGGNVGIGTTSPAVALHVLRAGGISTYAELGRFENTNANSGSKITFYGIQGSDPSTKLSGAIGFNQTVNEDSNGQPAFIVETGNNGSIAERLRITSGGRVGIGTTNPFARLSVVQDITTTAEFGSFGQFTLQGATNVNKLLSFGFNTATDAGFIQSMVNGTSYNNLLLNARGGNVLIGGTSNSLGLLDVTVTPSSYTAALGLGNITPASEGQSTGISFKHRIALDNNVREGARIAAITELVTASGYQSLAFYTMNVVTLAERMRILYNGNVGIGTTSPAVKLDVQGSSSGTGLGDGMFLKIKNTSTTTDTRSGITFGNIDGIGGSLAMQSAILKNAATGEYDMTWDMYGGAAGWQENLLYLDSNPGTVAIGTGGSLITSTYAGRLSVHKAGSGANIALGTGSNTNNAVMSRFVTYNANNGNSGNEGVSQFYGITSIESALTTSNSNASGNSGGYLMFKTKGDAGTLDERMRITSGGNVGIGTTDPSTKLHIQDNFDPDDALGYVLVENTNTTSGAAATNSSLNVKNYHGTSQFMQWQSFGLRIGSRILTNGGVGDVIFTAGADSEKMRLLAGGGLTFNGDTAAANALDDYEEGTWTGTLKGSISDPSTPVTATGNYTKIGRQVTVSIAFIAVNTTGAAGGVSVAGLPFSAAHINVGSVILEFFDFTSGRTSVACYTNPSGPTTILIESSGDDTPFGGVAHTAGTGRYVYTTLTYFV